MIYKKMFQYFLLLSFFASLNLSAMHSSEGGDDSSNEHQRNDYNARNLPTTSPLKRAPVIDGEDYDQGLIFAESPFKKSTSLARNLKNHTPNSNKCDENGNTRAHFAAVQNKPSFVKCLFEKSNSFDPNKADRCGRTPLHIAIQENNLNFISEAIKDARTDLIAVNNEDGKNTFEYIFQSNYISFHKDALCLLLIKGIHQSGLQRYQWFFEKIYGNNHQNLLHLLARYGCQISIKYILENGLIFQNATDLKRRTPLMIAAKYKQYEVVKVLVESQWTQIDLTDEAGNDVFYYAFQHCQRFNDSELNEEEYRDSVVLCIIKALCARGSENYLARWEPSGEHSCGNLLHYCASTGCTESARYLMMKKIINIHDRDRDDDQEFKHRKTPLHYAIQYRNLKLVKLFTSYDAFYIDQNYDLWEANLEDAQNYISWATMKEIDNYVRSCLSIIRKLKSGTRLDFIIFPH